MERRHWITLIALVASAVFVLALTLIMRDPLFLVGLLIPILGAVDLYIELRG